MKKLIRQYQEEFSNRKNVISVLTGIGLFLVAVIIQTLADKYVGHVQTVVVPDFILDHIPTIDIDGLIIQAVLLLSAITLFVIVIKPKYLAFGLKTLSLFIIIRAFLISLTHLGANPHELVFSPNAFGYRIYNLLFNTQNDFFFSSHTGAPLLGAFIFWPEKRWRYFYIFAGAFLGACMLLAHLHYSIDVFAAPFMTYGIFHLAEELFKKDYRFSRISDSN